MDLEFHVLTIIVGNLDILLDRFELFEILELLAMIIKTLFERTKV